jgi:hypothetical protein
LSKRRPGSDALVALLLVGVAFAVFNPSLGAGFVLVDDHEILAFRLNRWPTRDSGIRRTSCIEFFKTSRRSGACGRSTG